MKFIKLHLKKDGEPIWLNVAQICAITLHNGKDTIVFCNSDENNFEVQETPNEVLSELTHYKVL